MCAPLRSSGSSAACARASAPGSSHAASRPETPLLCSPVWADMRQMSKSQSAVIVHSSAANSRLRTASVMPSPLVQYDVPV